MCFPAELWKVHKSASSFKQFINVSYASDVNKLSSSVDLDYSESYCK